MALEKTYLEWYPEATQLFRIGFGAQDELISAGTTLDPGSTPTILFEELTVEYPETWVDRSSVLSIGNIAVVDDDENEMEDGAVQFTLATVTPGSPVPGDVYSFFVMADRLDNPLLQVATRVWVRVMP